MIGAVLKTVERFRVPWVRIPPPPDKNGLTKVRPVFILFGEDENPFQDVSLDGFEREAAEGGGLTTKCQRH